MAAVKKQTRLRITKIRAIPLKKGTSDTGWTYDYVLGYAKGIPIVIEDFEKQKDAIKETLKAIALAAFKSSGLSYQYKETDNTIFELTYSFSKSRSKFAFVTGAA